MPKDGSRHLPAVQRVAKKSILDLDRKLIDIFLSCLNSDNTAFRKYIETTDHFRKQKIPLSALFKESEGIDKRGRAHLTKLLWHRLSEVGKLYRNTLGVHFPEDMKDLLAAVQIRHDFVPGHRTALRHSPAQFRCSHNRKILACN